MNLHRTLTASGRLLACALAAGCSSSPSPSNTAAARETLPDGSVASEAGIPTSDSSFAGSDGEATGIGNPIGSPSPCVLRVGAWADLTCGSASKQLWSSVASDASGDHLIAGSGLTIPPINIASGAWTSTNSGEIWTNVNPGPIAGPVATNATGTVLVIADGGSVSPARMFVSTNSGASWSSPLSMTTSHGWGGLASDSAGAHLVAVGEFPGDIWTSTDLGASWIDRTASGPAHGLDWSSVASSSDGTHLVAVEGSGEVVTASGVVTGDIWTSGDSGVTWTNRTASGAAHNLAWRSVASDANGTNLIAVGAGIWTSSDSGATWTPQATNIATYAWVSVASSSDGTHLIAASLAPDGNSVSTAGDLWTSSDSGVTWTNQTSGTFLATQQWTGVASDATGAHVVAAARGGDIWSMSLATADAGAPDADSSAFDAAGD
jgi:hypothetical protein